MTIAILASFADHLTVTGCIALAIGALVWARGVALKARRVTERLQRERNTLPLQPVEPGFVFTMETRRNGRQILFYTPDDVSRVLGLKPESQNKTPVSPAAMFDHLEATAHPEDAPDLRVILHQALREHSAFHHEYRLYHPLKGERWILVSSARETTAKDGTGWRSVFTWDVTVKKSAATTLLGRERRYREIFERTSDAIFLIDVTAEGRFACVGLSRVAEGFLGAASADAVGLFIEEFLPADVACRCAANFRACIAAGRTISFEETVPDPDRKALAGAGVLTFHTHLSPILDADGTTRRIVGVARDISEAKRIERLRYEHERDYRTLVEDSPDIVIRYDRHCRRIYLNKSAHAFDALSEREWLGTTPTEYPTMGAKEAEIYQHWLEDCLTSGRPSETRLQAPMHNEMRVFWVRAVPERDIDGEIISIMVIQRDITDQVKAEQQLRQSEHLFRTLVENTPDYLIRYDRQGRHTYINPTVLRVHGEQALDWLGRPPETGNGFIALAEYRAKIAEVVAAGEQRQAEFEVHIDGRIRWILALFSPEFDAEGQADGVLMIGRDITDLVEHRRKTQQIAFSDSLTGLPNRVSLNETINHLCRPPDSGTAKPFGLMMMDLDRFKDVNDSLGHLIGDDLLRVAARRLHQSIGPDDVVARLGGDEFAVILPGRGDDQSLETIARNILRTLAEPFEIADRSLFVSASIGISRYPQDSLDVMELFRYADMAMYKTKSQGRNGFTFFDREMARLAAERMELATALRTAREKGQFELYFQPIVHLSAGQETSSQETRGQETGARMIGAEALLRWHHPQLGLLTPDKFITIAEDSELIVEIGRWVIETAARTAIAWNRDRPVPLRISVNLSPRQFVLDDLKNTIPALLKAAGCPAEWLPLEITESLLLEDNQGTRCTLDSLHSQGHRIAVDDFGTGYSAMSYLSRFPIDLLKIDRSFVQRLEQGHFALVKAIVSMAEALDMAVIAEGVETVTQCRMLEKLNCRMAQGYLFGRPMPEAEFRQRLAQPEPHDQPA